MRSSWRIVIAVGLTVLVVSAAGSSVRARGEIAVPAAGIGLSVQLQKRAYPRDALVPVRMTLVNRSARPLVIAGRCPSGYLEAQVLKASGEVVYPPIFAEGEGPLLQCKVGGQTALRPGGEMRGSAFVILESGHVRAAATLIVGGMDTDVTSRVVVVKTTPGVQPDVVLRTSGDTGANPGKISPAAGSTSLPGGVAVPG